MNIYRCTLEVMEIHLKYFAFSPCFRRIKLLNNLKNQSLFTNFKYCFMFGTYVMYLDIGRDDGHDYDGESTNKDYYK